MAALSSPDPGDVGHERKDFSPGLGREGGREGESETTAAPEAGEEGESGGAVKGRNETEGGRGIHHCTPPCSVTGTLPRPFSPAFSAVLMNSRCGNVVKAMKRHSQSGGRVVTVPLAAKRSKHFFF